MTQTFDLDATCIDVRNTSNGGCSLGLDIFTTDQWFSEVLHPHDSCLIIHDSSRMIT